MIDCDIRAPGWRQKLPRARALARKAVTAALKAAGVATGPKGGQLLELSLVLADDAFVQELNRDYRGKDKPTNVLSFPALDDHELEYLRRSAPAGPGAARDLPLGDIILALETVETEAQTAGKTMEDHYYHLIVHGLLHLIGYDHQNDVEAADMEQLETAILASVGINDPYAIKE